MCGRHAGWQLLAVGLLAGVSCEGSQNPPQEHRAFEGIRLFDENCVPSGGDTTDFMPQPVIDIDTTSVPPHANLPRNYSLAAACPNPALHSATEIEFMLPRNDYVQLLIYDRTNSPPIDTLYARMSPAGRHVILWARPGTDAVLRVEMTTGSGFRSHGDVQFVP